MSVQQLTLMMTSNNICTTIRLDHDGRTFSKGSHRSRDCAHYINLRPDRLVIQGSYPVALISEEWLRNIKDVTINGTFTQDDFTDLVRKLNCSCFSFINSPINCDLGLLLNVMPCVNTLAIKYYGRFSDFLPDLIDKTHSGPGLKNFTLINSEMSPALPTDVIQLVQNAKMDTSYNSTITFSYVRGNNREFETLIMRSSGHPRAVTRNSTKSYMITCFRGTIVLRIENFV